MKKFCNVCLISAILGSRFAWCQANSDIIVTHIERRVYATADAGNRPQPVEKIGNRVGLWSETAKQRDSAVDQGIEAARASARATQNSTVEGMDFLYVWGSGTAGQSATNFATFQNVEGVSQSTLAVRFTVVNPVSVEIGAICNRSAGWSGHYASVGLWNTGFSIGTTITEASAQGSNAYLLEPGRYWLSASASGGVFPRIGNGGALNEDWEFWCIVSGSVSYQLG